MEPQSLELHSVKNGFGRRRFDNAGRRSLRLYQKAFANERIRIVHNGSDHRVFRKIVSSESAVGSNRFLRALGSSVPETGDRSNIGACPNLSALELATGLEQGALGNSRFTTCRPACPASRLAIHFLVQPRRPRCAGLPRLSLGTSQEPQRLLRDRKRVES